MKRTLAGILITTLGAGLLLASLDFGHFADWLRDWWPLFVIGFGAVQLVDRKSGDWWPIIILLAGGILLFDSLNLANVNFWQLFWPVLIILLGLSLILQARSKPRPANHKNEDDIVAILGGTSGRNEASDYKGSKTTAIMGGVELNLAKASIKHEAVIDVFCLMGGIELRVPENAIVKNRATYIMGGIEDKTTVMPAKDAPVIYIDGTVIMGGVEIKR